MTRSGGRPLLLVVAPVMLSACGGAGSDGPTIRPVEILVRYSRFEPALITVRRGEVVTVTLRNDDPIDHEWIVGGEAVHEAHRNGSETEHETRPTEVSIPALSTKQTTVTFSEAGTLSFICHLPGHEAYGMVGRVDIVE